MSNESLTNLRVLRGLRREPSGEAPPAPQKPQVAENDSFRSHTSQGTCSSHDETSPPSPVSFDEGSPFVRPSRVLVGNQQQQQRDRSPPPNISSNDPSDPSNRGEAGEADESLRPSNLSFIQEIQQAQQMKDLPRSNSSNSARPSIQREMSSRDGRAVYKRQQSDISVRSFASEGDAPPGNSSPIPSGSISSGPMDGVGEVSCVRRRTPQAAAAAARIAAQRQAKLALVAQQQNLMRETSLRRVPPPPSPRYDLRRGSTESNMSSDNGAAQHMNIRLPGGPIHPPPKQRQFDPPVEMPPTPTSFGAGGGGSFNYVRGGESPTTPKRDISVRSFDFAPEGDGEPEGGGAQGNDSPGGIGGRFTVDPEASYVRRGPQAAAAAAAARISAQRQAKLDLMAQQQQQIMRESALRRVPRRAATENNLTSDTGAQIIMNNPSLPSLALRQPGGPIHPSPQQRQFDPPVELNSTGFGAGGGSSFSYGRGESPRTPQRDIIMNGLMGGPRGVSQRNIMMGGGPGNNVTQREVMMGGPNNVSQHQLNMQGMGRPVPSGPTMRTQRDPMINSSHFINSGGYGPGPSSGPDIPSRFRSPVVVSMAGPHEFSHPPQSAMHQHHQPPAPVPVHIPPPPSYHPTPQYSQPSMHARPAEKMIEIAPNIWARLRGADETWACIEHDYFMPVTCFGCTLELCCIQDADYVLCPACRVVSPMNGIDDTDSSMMRNGGVGLGFTFDDLRKWQSEIMMARQQARQRYGVYAA